MKFNHSPFIYVLLACLLVTAGYGQNVLLIGFGEAEDEEVEAILTSLEKLVKAELEKRDTVYFRTNEAWEVEESYRDKKDYVAAFDAQYTLNLNYHEISKELSAELINWTQQNPDEEVKTIRSGRLTAFNDNTLRRALAIEWSRDAIYFIENENVTRPEVAIEEFIQSEDGISPEAIELMDDLFNSIPLYYLQSDVADCVKLKYTEGIFDDCTKMRGEYSQNSNRMNIRLDFENPDGTAYVSDPSLLRMPTNQREFENFVEDFIEDIEWPSFLPCHD